MIGLALVASHLVSDFMLQSGFVEERRGRRLVKTAIYISHRLSSCRFCDKIAVFDQGRIVEYGTHAELIALGGTYARMWNAQAQWYVARESTEPGAGEGEAFRAG